MFEGDAILLNGNANVSGHLLPQPSLAQKHSRTISIARFFVREENMPEILEVDLNDLPLPTVGDNGTKITLWQRARGRMPGGAPNPIDCHVGQRLSLLRVAQNVSQEKLGKTLGISFQQIQKYERGNNRISASRLYDFAVFFGVGVEYFYQDMPAEVAQLSPASLYNKDYNKYLKHEKRGLSREEMRALVWLRQIRRKDSVQTVLRVLRQFAKYE